jgi:hypothetical protein
MLSLSLNPMFNSVVLVMPTQVHLIISRISKATEEIGQLDATQSFRLAYSVGINIRTRDNRSRIPSSL